MPALPTRLRCTIHARDRILELGSRTLLMGVLNVTPDSFSDGGRFLEPSAAVERAWTIAGEGADILDVGGESTRPGSSPIPVEEELRRVIPVLEKLDGKYPLPISIDTSKAAVAHAALERGAALVNDVTSLRADAGLGIEAARFGAGMILMHMRGEPANMQKIPPSPDILKELEQWAHEAVARAQNCGVSSGRIILDPGIGFGKTASQNLEILRNLDRLGTIGFPLLLGTSRKSFIGAVLKNAAGGRIWGTGATVAASIIFGAHILRVHDVAAMREIADMTDAIINERPAE
jgi:dihydropteroate synthase